MRAGVNLYKRPPRAADPDRMDVESEAGESTVTGDDEDEFPKSASGRVALAPAPSAHPRTVRVDDLLDDMEDLSLADEPLP